MEFVKKQVQPGVVVLAMTGSIRVGPNCQQIEMALEELAGQGNTSVVLDMAGVTYMDSGGIGTLVRGLLKLRKLGGTLRLAAVTAMVAGVLKLTQIDRTIEVLPTVADALKGLPPAPPA